MTVVLDASAVLAFVRAEPGSDQVEPVLGDAIVTAPNWAEVLGMTAQVGAPAGEVRALLKALGVRVEPVAEDDAEVAAGLAVDNPSLSLGDRFCLAVAQRLERPAYTADRAWRDATTVATVVVIR